MSELSGAYSLSSPLFDALAASKRATRKQRTPLEYLHIFFRWFPVQVIMLLVTFTDLAFLLFEYIAQSSRFTLITLLTSYLFFCELSVFIGFQWRDFFKRNKRWLIAECVIVLVSFIVEYFNFMVISHSYFHQQTKEFVSYVRYMRIIRFFRVPIIWKTRWKHLNAALRRLVSADRRRFYGGGYDLDLTYMYHNVIATSWPSEKVEALYRNHIENVAEFLDENHPDSYRVYNLCAERSYDEKYFHHNVIRYRMDDHNPAEILVMLSFAKNVQNFVEEDPAHNVAVVHCKGGKGRTGAMVAAYLVLAGLQPTADAAMTYFGSVRTSDVATHYQGVESPSQGRYVKYFERLIKLPGMMPPHRVVRLTTIRLRRLPPRYWDLGRIWFAIILRPSTHRNLHYVSNPRISKFNPVPWYCVSDTKSKPPAVKVQSECPEFTAHSKVFMGDSTAPIEVAEFTSKYLGSEDPKKKISDLDFTLEVEAPDSQPFSGDAVVKFFYNEDSPDPVRPILQFWMHPSFEEQRMVLPKDEVDGPHKDEADKEWHKQFSVEVGLAEEPDHS